LWAAAVEVREPGPPQLVTQTRTTYGEVLAQRELVRGLVRDRGVFGAETWCTHRSRVARLRAPFSFRDALS
jgi:hypothetical protein